MDRGERKKNISPYDLGSSQATHFVLVTSLFNMQTVQVHVPGGLLGALSPAAPQLNTPDGFVGAVPPVAGAEAGRGSSQEAHFAFEGSLSTIQTSHFHVPGAFVGALTPAADQLKLPVGAAGFENPDIAVGAVVLAVLFVAADSGRGSSHALHLVLADLLLSIQTGHFHESADFVGAFIPAASQLKPVDAGFAPMTNVNVGSENGSAAKAAPRSLA
jgi:hypothetical protein